MPCVSEGVRVFLCARLVYLAAAAHRKVFLLFVSDPRVIISRPSFSLSERYESTRIAVLVF